VNQPIAAICHGARVPGAAGIVAGKACSAYPAVGPDIAVSSPLLCTRGSEV